MDRFQSNQPGGQDGHSDPYLPLTTRSGLVVGNRPGQPIPQEVDLELGSRLRRPMSQEVDHEEDAADSDPQDSSSQGRPSLISLSLSSSSSYSPSDKDSNGELEDDDSFIDWESEDDRSRMLAIPKIPLNLEGAKLALGSVERHPNAPTTSKLQQKIQKNASKGIELNDQGLRKGSVRHNADGQLEYLLNGKWIPAVFHEDIREHLLGFADSRGEYEEEPARGADALDRTSYHADQEKWAFMPRNARPNILFAWHDPYTRDHTGYEPQVWFSGGYIVLSNDQLPVKKWIELPCTISGQCEGWRIEAWRRLQPNLTMTDIKARMPRLTSKGLGLVQKVVKGPALANRAARDRCRMSIPAWYKRDGTSVKERRMVELIPEDIQRTILATNSTRCWRDLMDAEMYYIEDANKGTAASLAKAGQRRVTEASRSKRIAEITQRAARKGLLVPLTTHKIVEGALDRPNQRYGPKRNRRSAGISATPSATFSPLIKEECSENDEEENGGSSTESPFGKSGSGSFLKRTAQENKEGLPKRRRVPATEVQARRDAIQVQRAYQHMEARASQSDVHTAAGNQQNNPGMVDCRYQRPSSTFEVLSVQEALSITLDDFIRYVGFPPVYPPNPNDSYATQLRHLQDSFNAGYLGPDPNPILRSRGPWFGSIDNWRLLPTPCPQASESNTAAVHTHIDPGLNAEAGDIALADSPAMPEWGLDFDWEHYDGSDARWDESEEHYLSNRRSRRHGRTLRPCTPEDASEEPYPNYDLEDSITQDLDSDGDETNNGQLGKGPEGRLTRASPSTSSYSSYQPDSLSDEDLEDEMDPLNSDDGKIQETPRGDAKPKRKAARHPDAPEVSKLQQKIQSLASRGISVDDQGLRKGTVRNQGSGLEFLQDGVWIPAYTGDQGSYDEEPERGADCYDRTAFKWEQKAWRLNDREQRPDVLFQFSEDPENDPNYTPPTWYLGSKIVLSMDAHPLKKWLELPLTISGQCEGLRMEAWKRLNPSIGMNDIKGRMPRTTSTVRSRKSKVVKGSVLANQCARDRYRVGIKALYRREGSAVKERRMLELIPTAEQRTILNTNSTRCWRDLTNREYAYIEKANKGTPLSLAKAGSRRVTDQIREERNQEKEKRAAKKGNQEPLKVHEIVEALLERRPNAKYAPGRRCRYVSTTFGPSPDLDHSHTKEEVEKEDDDNVSLESLSPRPRKRRRIPSREVEERRRAIHANQEYAITGVKDDNNDDHRLRRSQHVSLATPGSGSGASHPRTAFPSAAVHHSAYFPMEDDLSHEQSEQPWSEQANRGNLTSVHSSDYPPVAPFPTEDHQIRGRFAMQNKRLYGQSRAEYPDLSNSTSIHHSGYSAMRAFPTTAHRSGGYFAMEANVLRGQGGPLRAGHAEFYKSATAPHDGYPSIIALPGQKDQTGGNKATQSNAFSEKFW
ncbi:MAG: hypothetical protein Q9181_005285 [Wetmoreana brouardii]